MYADKYLIARSERGRKRYRGRARLREGSRDLAHPPKRALYINACHAGKLLVAAVTENGQWPTFGFIPSLISRRTTSELISDFCEFVWMPSKPLKQWNIFDSHISCRVLLQTRCKTIRGEKRDFLFPRNIDKYSKPVRFLLLQPRYPWEGWDFSNPTGHFNTFGAAVRLFPLNEPTPIPSPT